MKYIAKIAAFTAIFLIINLILCGFMPPDNGSSLGMWRSYHQKQSIDIAVIGSSLASCALPEEELAAATGETVALMATNAQSLDMSQIALETLLREHSPRYVILVMDLTNMTGKPYAKAQKAFLYAELQTDSWKDKPADLLRYMTSRDNFTGADSLNALFPWQSGSWPTDWPATIQQKWNAVLNRLPHRRGAAHAQPGDTTVINFDTVGAENTWNQNAHDFSAQHIEELTSMLQLCQENGTRLLLISAPKTTLDVVSYETYFDDYAYFKQLAAQYGASYYDFNLAKPELFENKEPDYHKDFTHMNAAGGHAFSLSMAKFLAMLDAGQDVESLFETPSEYLVAVNYITNVYLTPEVHPDKILLLAGSMALLAILLYSLQQYADFSGGIDMVLGVAQLYGIEMMPNFRQPYFSTSLGDFWRRWHISLGAWMRDYLFYPFALTKPMQRFGKWATSHWGKHFGRVLPAAVANLLVFAVVGIWHGPQAHYLAWGLYNGLVIALADLLEPAFKKLNTALHIPTESRGWHVFRIVRTFIIVNIGWYFDRNEFVQGCIYLRNTFTDFNLSALAANAPGAFAAVSGPAWGLVIISTLLVFAHSVLKEQGRDPYAEVQRLPLALRWGLYYLVIFMVLLSFICVNETVGFLYANF